MSVLVAFVIVILGIILMIMHIDDRETWPLFAAGVVLFLVGLAVLVMRLLPAPQYAPWVS